MNGQSLLGASHQEAVDCLRLSASHLNLVVCKGYDKSDMIRSSNRLGSRASETGSELSQSVSSLDREDYDNSTILQNSHTDNNFTEVFEENKEQEEEKIRAAEEIAKIANEVALLNRIDDDEDDENKQMVLAREKSTQEKVSLPSRFS